MEVTKERMERKEKRGAPERRISLHGFISWGNQGDPRNKTVHFLYGQPIPRQLLGRPGDSCLHGEKGCALAISYYTLWTPQITVLLLGFHLPLFCNQTRFYYFNSF
jgi:hypothetical protein